MLAFHSHRSITAYAWKTYTEMRRRYPLQQTDAAEFLTTDTVNDDLQFVANRTHVCIYSWIDGEHLKCFRFFFCFGSFHCSIADGCVCVQYALYVSALGRNLHWWLWRRASSSNSYLKKWFPLRFQWLMRFDIRTCLRSMHRQRICQKSNQMRRRRWFVGCPFLAIRNDARASTMNKIECQRKLYCHYFVAKLASTVYSAAHSIDLINWKVHSDLVRQMVNVNRHGD